MPTTPPGTLPVSVIIHPNQFTVRVRDNGNRDRATTPVLWR